MIRKLLINAFALAAATFLVPGITLAGGTWVDKAVTVAVVALIFGLVNTLVRPPAAFLSAPVLILTLGLFMLVIDALMLLLTSWVAGKLDVPWHVDGFVSALLAALVVSVVAAVQGRDRKKGDE